MRSRRRGRRRNGGAGNGAQEADVPTYSGEGDGGDVSDAEGSAAGSSPGHEAGVAAAADTSGVAPFLGDDGGGVPEAEGGAAGRRPVLEAGVAVAETAAADTNRVALAPFFGDDGGGVSGAAGGAAGRRPVVEAGVAMVEAAKDTKKVAPFVSEADGSAAGRRSGLVARVDVVEAAKDTNNKVAPFVGEDDQGASEADGSLAARREAAGGCAMAPAVGKIEPFSGSRADGDACGSGGCFAGRCDDRVNPPLDPGLPNATRRSTTMQSVEEHLDISSAVIQYSTEPNTKQQQSASHFDNSAQGSRGSSLAGGEESMLKVPMITETILSWQLKDVMDDDLYRDKVKPVPNHLESVGVEEYMNTISNLLIEECRATLKASLQRIKTCPSAYSVTDVLNTDSSIVYFIDIDLHLVSDASHMIHMAREGDVYLFSTLSHQDTDFSHSFTCFGMVVGTSAHSNFHQGFKVVMLEKPKKIKFGCFLTNVLDTISVWNTLKCYDKNTVTSGINSIMKLKELINTRCDLCNNQSGWTDTTSNNLILSKSQLGIAKFLSGAVQCTHSNGVKMVTGPPGSGKTQILVAILHLLHQFDFRVLVCVPQKTGAFQLWKLLEKSGYPITEIIVLDSLKGIRLPKKIHQTCLHTKSHEFLTCLVMVRQWTEQMQMLLELKMYCPSSCNHMPKHGRCSRSSLPLFTSKLYRKAFLSLALDLRKCLIELRDKFSRMCLPSNNASDIAKVLDLLQAFQNLLFNELPSEDNIQQAFGHLPPLPLAEKMIELCSGSYGTAIARQLDDARLRFLDCLQTFRKSIIAQKFGNIKEVECYCIAHSRVMIGTPQSIFQLHAMTMNLVNLLIVDDAARIREVDLISPLCLPLKHVLFFGDFCASPPMVKSKLCYESGFHTSLFQRLLKSKSVPQIKLDEQFAIEPNIFRFVNNRFYGGKIKNGSNVSCSAYSHHFADLEFSTYCFIDVTRKDKNQGCIEIAGTLYMLHILQNCWEDVEQNLHIAIVCFPSSPLYAIKDGLISKYAGGKKIKLSVVYADSIDEEMYDVVIISGFFKNQDQIDLKDMTTAITRARHCFWFLGDLSACPGTLGELIDDARDRNYLIKLDPKRLQMVTDLGGFPSPNNESLMVGVESTWNGRPYRSKYILGLMRNQGNSDTCALESSLVTEETQYKFKYADQEPPEEFDWILCTCDLNKKYKDVADKDIGDELIEHRGSERLETVHKILENPGVLGRKRLQLEVTQIFSVKSCSKLEIKENEDMRMALSTLDAESVFVGTCRISKNYFSLKPGQVYHYDSTMPYLSPRSSLPYAHAVMMIGSGTEIRKLPARETKVHLNFQNSAGNLFGDNGFGKVGSSSVRSLYRITV